MAACLGVGLIVVVSAGAAGPAAAGPSFVPGTPFDAGLEPTAVVVADFNRDQTPDLAVTGCVETVDPDSGETTTYSDLKILLGDGSGGVRPGAPPPLPPDALTCGSLATADFNGDGAPDLAVAISSGSGVATEFSPRSTATSATRGRSRSPTSTVITNRISSRRTSTATCHCC
jgi:FG-GAP repeat